MQTCLTRIDVTIYWHFLQEGEEMSIKSIITRGWERKIKTACRQTLLKALNICIYSIKWYISVIDFLENKNKWEKYIQTFQRPCVCPVVISYPSISDIIKPEVRIFYSAILVQRCMDISGNISMHRNALICVCNNPGASKINFDNVTTYESKIRGGNG